MEELKTINIQKRISKNEKKYRRVQGIVGDHSLAVILPKSYAINLGIGKGDFVKVSEEEDRIVIEKAE